MQSYFFSQILMVNIYQHASEEELSSQIGDNPDALQVSMNNVLGLLKAKYDIAGAKTLEEAQRLLALARLELEQMTIAALSSLLSTAAVRIGNEANLSVKTVTGLDEVTTEIVECVVTVAQIPGVNDVKPEDTNTESGIDIQKELSLSEKLSEVYSYLLSTKGRDVENYSRAAGDISIYPNVITMGDSIIRVELTELNSRLTIGPEFPPSFIISPGDSGLIVSFTFTNGEKQKISADEIDGYSGNARLKTAIGTNFVPFIESVFAQMEKLSLVN
jgi:hypothetical protein